MARLGRLLGRARRADFVPAMDGPLQPNRRLDGAAIRADAANVTDICLHEGRLLGARGAELWDLGAARSVGSFDAAISALAAADGRLAVAVAGQGIWQTAGEDWELAELPDPGAVTAICWHGANLYVARGARGVAASAWRKDLLQRGRSGSVGVLRKGAFDVLAEGLSWPAGLLVREGGEIVFSEAWRHRLCTWDGAVRPLHEDLPAYPGRLCRREDGDVMLACFAPRRALFEFVLSEDAFRRDMLRTMGSDDWIAPSLTPSRSTRSPIVQGEIRQMGVMKPWAPSASYGLVVRFGPDMRPRESWHSRADGTRHGIVDLVEDGSETLALSVAAGAVLTLPAGAPE